MGDVALVRCNGYGNVRERIEKCLDLIGGFKLKGDFVLIKPNVGFPIPHANTNPAVVSALVEFFLDAGADEVIVGEGKSFSAPTSVCMKKSGMEDAVKKAGGKIRLLEKDRLIKIGVGGKRIKEVYLPETVVECDVLINVPKLKTNSFTKLTLGIKNLIGFVPMETRKKFHRTDLSQSLVDLLKVIRPDLTIIDGVVAMEGQGPALGKTVDLHALVAGMDIVAVDSVASLIAGFDPWEIDTIRIAEWEGIGKLGKIRGERVEKLKKIFKRPISAIEGMYENVNVYMGAACVGCIDPTMIAFNGLKRRGILSEIGEINVIIGKDPPLPDEGKNPVIIIGDCAKEHAEKGFFIPGCPPLMEVFDAMRRIVRYLYEKGNR
ncbi:MAG: DUF362 domain-containing protein [Candidatus Syntropharchaeia archaeon]